MRGRICLSSPPTGLDAHSQSALNPPFPVTPLPTVPGHALALRSASHLAASNDRSRPQRTSVHEPGTLRCKRSLAVSEYQPIVHRLRLSPSASARLTLSGLTFRRKP